MCFHGQSCSIDASRVFIGYVVCPDMYIFSIDQPMVYPGVFCYGFCVRPFYFSGFFITDVFTFQCQVRGKGSLCGWLYFLLRLVKGCCLLPGALYW